MRHHPSTHISFPEYERIHHTQRRRVFDRENPEKAQRHNQMRRNRCNPFGERGIRLNTLPAGSRVPAIIGQQQWEGFIQPRPMFCAETVREFYANMIPGLFHEHCVVKMGEIEVRITPEDIDAYYHTPRRENLGATYGLSRHPAFLARMSPDIAASLRRNGYDGWDNNNQLILKAEMHYDLAFLMLFIKASLKPSTHNTDADSQVAEVLYSLHNNLPMDIGHIIWMELLDAGMTLDGILPFPCLITHFCMQAGVPIGQLTAPMKDFTKTQLQHQVTAATKLEEKRRADPNERVRELAVPVHSSSESASDSDPDFDPAAPAAAEAYVHSDDTPLYMRRFIDHMTTQVSGIDTNMNLGFQDMRLRMDRYGTRLDGFDARLAQAGYPAPQEPPEQQQQDRRRVRGRQSGGGASSSRR